jgi:inosine-uridine nucleoside N-ribohydrolase
MSNNEKINCWLDCDPGHDDSFAILLASYTDIINLIAVSTVAGNQTIEKTTLNALNVMNLLGWGLINFLKLWKTKIIF